jgi:hypothetical protein
LVLTIKADCVLCEVRDEAEKPVKDLNTAIEHDVSFTVSRLHYRDIYGTSILNLLLVYGEVLYFVLCKRCEGTFKML